MKLIVCTFVFLLSLSSFLIAAKISTNSIEGIDQKSVDFQDFVDVEDERTALLFDFNREFNLEFNSYNCFSIAVGLWSLQK